MVSIVLWCLPFVLSFLGSSAQPQINTNTINLGASITAGTNSSWRSPSGDFAFGFYPLLNGQFLVGIWFDKIPERTLVWSANRDDPARTGSTINFTLDGQLVLTHSNGTGYLIYNGTFGASSALMQNDGNFVVKTNSSKVIWRSFDSPTDTILLGQVLVMGQKLYSNANGTVDYSTGQYMLEVQLLDGNVVMSAYKFADPGYWYTATEGNKNVSLIFNQITAFMYVVNHTSIMYNMTSQVPTPIGDYYHRATINDYGNLQQFVYHKENGGGWKVVWEPDSIKAEPCLPNNICGVYGFCTSIDNTINCTCLPGYSPRDPSIPSKGCYPDTVIDFCAPNSSPSNFSLEKIDKADFPNNREFADMAIVTEVDEEECRKAIMDDCFAVAGVWVESACYKKRTPLLNARSSDPSTINRVAFIKIPKANNNNQIQDKDDDSPSWIALLAGLLLCSIMTLLFATISIYHHPLAQPYISQKQLPVPKPVEINLKAFSFQELLQATNGLRNKLGRGAFGTVYSGVLTLEAEEVEIAVKKLEKFLYFHELHAQIPPTISSGSNITAGSGNSWRSLSDEFAFGFYPLPNNLYLVGIWFNKIPEGTLVWSANRDSPAVAGSTVILTSEGQLTLTHLNGSVVQIYGARAEFGFMQDDGNFVLKDDSSRVIWQSFDSPTDTILPGQVLNAREKLYSNANGTVDYSTGNFMLQMQPDGKLVLSAYHFADPGYWLTAETRQKNVDLVFNNDTASMYLANGAGDNIYALTRNVSTPVGDYYHRATINDRGDFQQFAYHKSNNSGWTRVWRAINEPCVVNAICGVYGMCSSPNNETATCNCIPGYIPLDPNHLSKGCHPETVVNYCADPSMRNFTIEVIDDADFPFEGFADLARVRNVDLEGCKKTLMDDCYSLSASLVDSRCIKKRMPLLNARKSFSTKGRQALVKVPMKSNPDIQEHKKNNDFDTRVFLKISLIVTATLAFCFGVSAIYYHPAPRRFIRRKRYSNASSIGINFQEFKYLELQKATNGFSKTLGRGSSAQVYSGILSMKDIQIDIATFYEKGNTNVGGDLGNRNPAFTFRSNVSESLNLLVVVQRVMLS
ncbi:hypothetical protein NC651_030165 [Populus alba x Populus x berolinensis]|nr:hypothetical protein NC651_030165 [Populus alba x Populus x berolinensis]